MDVREGRASIVRSIDRTLEDVRMVSVSEQLVQLRVDGWISNTRNTVSSSASFCRSNAIEQILYT